MKSQVLAAIIALSVFPFAGAAAYDFTPGVSLSLSEEYNDNINLTHTDRKGDFISRISPSIYGSLRSANADLRVDYSPAFSFYKSHDNFNTVSHAASARGLFTLSGKTGLSITDAFILSKEPEGLATVANLGPIRERTELRVNTLSSTLSHRMGGKISLSLGGSYIDTDAKGGGAQDSKTYSGTIGLTYTRNERSSLSANAVYTKYDSRSGGDTNSQNYTLGTSYRLSPTLTIGATGGAVLTKAEDTGSRSTDFSGSIELSKQFNRGSAALSYTQAVVPGLQERRPLLSQAVNLRLARSLTHLTTASATASYNKFKSLNASDTNTDTWRIGADLAYSIRRWASVALSYNFTRLDDKINSARGYYNHTALLVLRLNYGRETAR